MHPEQIPAVLVSADAQLVHHVQASAAASGTTVEVLLDKEQVRARWRSSAPVLVGSDLAPRVVEWGLPARQGVYLAGFSESAADLGLHSMPLSASVILLPQGSKWLASVVAGGSQGAQAGVVAFRGGAGGVGTSTLSLGVAALAASHSLRVALVDADPFGGGLDLAVGAENQRGWRWDTLRGSIGQIADISSMLVKVDGITLVSMERASQPVPEQAMNAVVESLARSHDLVLVDLGRGVDLPATARLVMVTTSRVRAVAATRAVVAQEKASGIVVHRGGSVAPKEAAFAVSLPLVGVLPWVKEIPRLADQGVPPILGGRWKKGCAQVLQWCLDDDVTRRA